MLNATDLESLAEPQLREVTRDLLDELQALKSEVRFKGARIEQLTYELARYKRIRFDRTSEKLDRAQASLLEEALDEDLCALEEELEQLQPTRAARQEKSKPRRERLPEHLPRVVLRHEPESTVCACGCEMQRIGEDVSEKMRYKPGDFTVEQHIRGKWVCGRCEKLVQAPVDAQVIDKGIATPSLLAQVMVAKYADHSVLRTRPPP